MPFTKSVGLSFNCGFCRGFVYEDASNSSKTSNVSKKGSDRDDQQSVPETEGKKSIPVSDGENSQSEKVCLSAADRFRTLFGGPQLSARNFERYYETVKNAFNSMRTYSSNALGYNLQLAAQLDDRQICPIMLATSLQSRVIICSKAIE